MYLWLFLELDFIRETQFIVRIPTGFVSKPFTSDRKLKECGFHLFFSNPSYFEFESRNKV